MVAHEAHDAALAHHEDDVPSDEPSTPMWLPLLGGALLIAGLGAFLVLAPTGKSGQELAPQSPAADGTAEPQAGQPQPGQPQPGQPQPGQARPNMPSNAMAAPAPGGVQAQPPQPTRALPPNPQPAMPSGGCGE